MMYSADQFKTASQFRSAFYGCSVVMVDGRRKAASRITDKEVAEFQISAIWDRTFEQWVTPDRVSVQLTRELDIWSGESCRYFAPMGCNCGEEVSSAPANATDAEIVRAWQRYEQGQVDWMELSSWGYWDMED